MSDLALSIALGVALAAATGFRVFLPMLIASGAAYTGHLHLDDGFAWLGSPSALIMLSVAALAEILAYYIPVVDNLLDVVAAPAAFIAGTIRDDRHAADGEVDGGRDRRRRGRWIDARIGRRSEGALDSFDGWARELCHLHCGTWRRSPHILFGAYRTACRDRAGRASAVRGDPIAPPAASSGQTIGRAHVRQSRLRALSR
jgi:hypothetical protein